ncbi:MAG: monofunctional biosynthetic peptidoglycan transglycosylase [Chitinophagaceae bacterium]|nr:monofunctional biosynthetic peptidoglycan transglycosylase [Chitinophagaceae bacterium]
MAAKGNKRMQKVWRIIKRTLIFLFIFHLFYILILKWVDPPITITQFVSFVTGDGLKRDYVSMNEISPYAKLAVISSEDQLFPDHSGFDWKSIEKARSYNKKKPNRIRGASTISQQVAKNVFLWQGRSYFRKGLEVYFTFMIELIWGKKRILELYLNISEMGKGVYGIEAASQKYFNKPAQKLTRSEVAMIAACLPNPKEFTVKPISRHVAGKFPWILIQMINLQDDPDIQNLLQ